MKVLATIVALNLALAACGGGTTRPQRPTAANQPEPVRPAEDFAARAPASARLLATVDLRKQALMAELAAGVGEGLGADPRCGTPWTRIEVVRAAVGTDTMLFEVDGQVGLEDVACLFGMPAPSSDRMVVAGMVVSARAGGLRIADEVTFATGAPPDLARRFTERGRSADALVVVSDLGAPGRPVHLDLTILADRSLSTVEVGDRGRARGLHALVTRIASLMQAAGGGAIEVQLDDTAVTIDWRVPPGKNVSGLLRSTLIEAFRVPSSAMWPSFLIDDYIYVLKGPLLEPLARGDVVVAKVQGRDMIWRVAALAGQRVHIEQGRVTVDGAEAHRTAAEPREGTDLDERTGRWLPFTANVATEDAAGHRHAVVTDPHDHDVVDTVVPAGHVFLLGDNRALAADSRAYGPVAVRDVVGKVVLIWLSKGPEGVRWNRTMIEPD